MTKNDLRDDLPLLRKMMADMQPQKDIYKPGSFWMQSALMTARSLERYGLENFRANKKATPGVVFTDAPALSLYDYEFGSPRGGGGEGSGVEIHTPDLSPVV